MSRIRAVILDMDGLMLDTEPIYRRIAQLASRDIGFDMSDEDHVCMIGKGIAEASHALAARMGTDFNVEQFWARCREHNPTCFESMPINHKPGLTDFLDFVDVCPLFKAVATSTRMPSAHRHLQRAGIFERFTTIVTGDQVTRGKPAPDLFQLTAERLGVDARACVVLEDSEAGITGAHAAGMRCVMIPDLVHPSDVIRSKADIVLPSLIEARAWIESRI
jgi:beta-phosphoglucomutase-like phosphatase (HAD superfamily)